MEVSAGGGQIITELPGCDVLVVCSGYDSDVAREKVVDYVTKIYSASIRNMSGTKPHLQHKELPVEDRYAMTSSLSRCGIQYVITFDLCFQASCESCGAAAR